MHVLAIVGLCVVGAVAGQLLMKKGMNSIGEVFLKDIFTPKIFQMVFQKYVFLGMALYAISSILWLVALSKGELSYLYPLMSVAYILTSIFAVVFLKENLTMMRFLGILLISAGAFLVVFK
jgi:uncharacterized membrane protein